MAQKRPHRSFPGRSSPTPALFVAALVALSLLFLSAPAHASRTVIITGGGWGHGIGMSQYGALGRARLGKSAREILTHYYSGVAVDRQRMPHRIRVGLLQYRSSIKFRGYAMRSGGGRIELRLRGSAGSFAAGPAGTKWRLEASPAGGMRIFKDGKKVVRSGRTVFARSRALVVVFRKFGTILSVAGKPYDYAFGRLKAGWYSSDTCAAGNCLRLVASLSMQHYLYGLGEVPSSWPTQALRTQAIAGRTYAYRRVVTDGQDRYPCDCAVYDSTLDQAYIGDAKRTGSGDYWDEWKGAVDSTKGMIVTYGGQPIQALYSSSSGGHTEHNENVWGGNAYPYLRGVRDRADGVSDNPNHSWRFTMPWKSFSARLNSYYGVGELKSFSLLKPFGVSGRVTVPKERGGGVKIVGGVRKVRTSGWSIRSALALKDSLFRVKVVYDVAPAFQGSHGLEASGAVFAAGPVRRMGSGDLVQDLRNGRLTFNRRRDAVVWQHGPLLGAYLELGGARGPLGLPVSGTWGRGPYLGANYEGGLLLWSRATGAHAVPAALVPAYRRHGGPSGQLGLPVADALGKQRFQRFEGGVISHRRSGVLRVLVRNS
ncbi:MAG: SpoIID/LytB domain-containing protein [Actinomycetota bacterium]|nr:SpoIID/LytB domain-containing protein [Actinomycetota bacterium]